MTNLLKVRNNEREGGKMFWGEKRRKKKKWKNAAKKKKKKLGVGPIQSSVRPIQSGEWSVSNWAWVSILFD